MFKNDYCNVRATRAAPNRRCMLQDKATLMAILRSHPDHPSREPLGLDRPTDQARNHSQHTDRAEPDQHKPGEAIEHRGGLSWRIDLCLRFNPCLRHNLDQRVALRLRLGMTLRPRRMIQPGISARLTRGSGWFHPLSL